MSKRSAEDVTAAPNASTTYIAPALVTSVITIMKAAYGSVPKAFWGLCKGGEAAIAGGTSREFTIDTTDSFKYYSRHLTEPGAYSIVRLRTAGGFSRKITILDSIRKVSFGSKFNSEIVFPSSESQNLEEIEFDEECAFNRQIAIPSGVRLVSFGRWLNRSVTLLSSLRELKFGEKYNCPLDLPQGLVELYLGDRFNRWFRLPDSIRVVRFGADFNKIINLPTGLRELELGYSASHALVLPHGLQRVTFRDTEVSSSQNIVLPDTLKYANIGCGVNIEPEDLPLGLEELVWHRNVEIDIPLSVRHITLGKDFYEPSRSS